MKLPLEIAFHNLQNSAAAEQLVREKAAKLDEFCDQILSCRVAVEVPHRHHERWITSVTCQGMMLSARHSASGLGSVGRV
jgi:ribosome-associated translation inhibitor RaiA